MENVAIVQPTPQLKSKEIGARKTSQRLSQSPTQTTNTLSFPFEPSTSDEGLARMSRVKKESEVRDREMYNRVEHRV